MLKLSLIKLIVTSWLCCLIASCASTSFNAPVKSNDNISVAHPEAVGFDSEKLKKLLNKIAKHDSIFGPEINHKNDYVGINSILIMRHNRLVLERYFNGAGKLRAHPMASLGKSIMSAVVGVAIENNHLKSPAQKVLPLLPVVQGEPTQAQKMLSVHHLLSMTVDWHCDGSGVKAFRCSKLLADEKSPVHKLMNQPFEITENQLNYDDANPYLIDVILTLHAQQNAAQLFEQFLKQPLKLENNVFETGKLTSREMLKFGQMYLNNGKVDGVQVISPEWVKLSTSPYVKLNNQANRYGAYGYFWWITEFAFNQKKFASFYAAGNGGQFIFVVPELALVVVFTGSNFNDYQNMFKPHQMMEKYILPALKAD